MVSSANVTRTPQLLFHMDVSGTRRVQTGTSLERASSPSEKETPQVNETVNSLLIPSAGHSNPNSSWWKLSHSECCNCLKDTILREDVLL